MGNTENKMKGKKPSTPRELLEKYIDNIVSTYNQNDLKQGICHGMCLDWIQSMINGTGSKFTDYSKLKKDQMDVIFALPGEFHEKFKVATIDECQRRKDKAYSKLTEAEQCRQRALHNQGKLQKLSEQEERLKSVGPHIMKYLSDRTNFEAVLKQQSNAVSRKWDELESEMKHMDRLHGEAEKIREGMAQTARMYPHVYEQFKKKYAEKLFKDIDIDQGKHYSWTPEKLSEWFSKIGTCLNLLGSKQCSMLTFQLDSADGHVIAFYREGENYHLFDPNVGWFRVQGFDSALELFEDIWHILYRDKKYNNSTWRIFFHCSKIKK